jgi:hypothetical protein
MKTTKTTSFVVCCYRKRTQVSDMKGPNPFLLWAQAAGQLAGRKNEINMYKTLLNEIALGKINSLLVIGGPGIGRSALLDKFRDISEKKGFYSIKVKVAKGENSKRLLERSFAELTNYLNGLVAKTQLSERIAKNIAEKKDLFLAADLIKRYAEGLIILIDDLDRIKDSDAFHELMETKGSQIRSSHMAFVFSSTHDVEQFPGVRMRLASFDEHDIREMILNALKKEMPKMGEGCLKTIIADSEGNPRVAKTMCYVLYDRLGEKEKIITRKHYIVNFAEIIRILTSEFFDALWSDLAQSEREVVAAFASAAGPAHISDIAKMLGKRHVTTLALRLEKKGQLIRLDRGIYKVFTKLYGKYAMQRVG